METDERDDGYVEQEDDEEDANEEFLYRQQSSSILSDMDSSVSIENPTGNQQMTVSLLTAYAASNYLPFRHLAASSILESLRMAVLSVEAYSEQDDVIKFVDFVNKLSQDMENSVKCALLKSLPNVISFCSEYDSPLVSLKPLITAEFLPIALKSVAYEDTSKVRKEGYAVLKYMLAENFITMNDVEEKINQMYNNLLESTPNFFNVITASNFMVRMAPIVGEELTEKLIVPRITELCSSKSVKKRETCVHFLVDLSCFVNPIITENIIIPHFLKLCQDEMWYVRKACAETIVMLACTCSMETRKTVLARTFVDLLHDSHNNITCCAFKQLGPFITTFSQPAVTSLTTNLNGELLLVHTKEFTFEFELQSRQTLYRYYDQDKCDESGCNLVPLPSANSITNKYFADSTSSSSADNNNEAAMQLYVYEQNINEENEDDGDEQSNNSVAEINKIIDQEADQNKQKIVINNLENQPDIIQSCIINKMSKVESSINKEHSYTRNSDAEVTSTIMELVEDNNYNSFLYWREPIADITENDFTMILESQNFHGRRNIGNNMNRSDEKMSFGDNNDLRFVVSWNDDRSSQYAKPKNSPGIIDFRNIEFGSRSIHTFSDYTRLLPSYLRTSNEYNDDLSTFYTHRRTMSRPVLPQLPKQNVIPQPLLDAYVTMPDATNSEVRRYCAYTFPAVLLTLGSSNWHHLKNVFSKLANDSEWTLKQIIANSMTEVANIIGPDYSTQDLLPLYNLLINDFPDVRTTALKHLSAFVKCLRPTAQSTFLPHLMEFAITDYAWNWRFREDLCGQLTELLDYFSPADCYKYICPVAFNLLMDKVAAVRLKALTLMANLMRVISVDSSLLRNTILELVNQFAHSNQWTGKQTFVFLCSCLIDKSALPDEMFARDILPHLLDLSGDRIPNIRIAVARTLAADIMPHPYFSDCTRSPHYDILKQVLRRLESDDDRDVRYFAMYDSNASPIAASTGCSPISETEGKLQV